jgi:signal transduction histidine kinase
MRLRFFHIGSIQLLSFLFVPSLLASVHPPDVFDTLKINYGSNLNDTIAIGELKSLAVELQSKDKYQESLKISEQIRLASVKYNYPKGIAEAWKIAGEAHLSMSEYEEALKYLRYAQIAFKKLHLGREEAYTLVSIGKAYSFLSEYENALQQYNIVLEILTHLSDEELKAMVLNNIGNVYFYKSSYERALEYYLKSLETGEHLTKKKKFIVPLNNVGVVHARLGQYKDALHYFLLYLKDMDTHCSKRDRASVLLNIGESYCEIGDFRLALDYLKRAVQMQLEMNDRRGLALSYCTQAKAYLNLNERSQAHLLYSKSISLAREIKENEALLSPLKGLCSLYIREKKFTEGERLTSEMNAIAVSIKSKLWLEQTYLIASQLDSARGNYVGAYFWLCKYLPLHDSLFNDQKTRHVVQMREKYEAERREKEILLLSEAKKFSELEQTSQRNQLIIIIAFSVIAIVSLFCWVRVKARNSRILKIQKEAIARANADLKSLIDKVENQNKSLEMKNETLNELHHEKDTLIGIVAHDLRSPLNRIKGLTEVMTLQGSLSTDQNFFIENIQKVCEDGNDLIKDILEINEYESSLRSPEVEVLDVSKFIADMIDSYQPWANNKQLIFNYEYHEQEQFYIAVDSNYLSRVLDNLFSNAIKFSPHRSTIHVTVGRYNRSEIRITVRDEGPGFSKDDIPNLFKKFKRLSARPTGGEHSTGLGLSIVKTLMDKLEGKISVLAGEGMGATFVLTFKEAATSPVKSVSKELV